MVKGSCKLYVMLERSIKSDGCTLRILKVSEKNNLRIHTYISRYFFTNKTYSPCCQQIGFMIPPLKFAGEESFKYEYTKIVYFIFPEESIISVSYDVRRIGGK